MATRISKKEATRRKRISRSLLTYYRNKRRSNRQRGKSLERYYAFKTQLEAMRLTKPQLRKRLGIYKEKREEERREIARDRVRIEKAKRKHRKPKKVKKTRTKKKKRQKRRQVSETLRDKFEYADYEMTYQTRGYRLFEKSIRGRWQAYKGSQNIVMDTNFSFLLRSLRKGAKQYSVRVKLLQPASSAGVRRVLNSGVVGQYTYEYLKDDIDNIIRNAAQQAATSASDTGSKRKSFIIEIGLIAWLPIE